MENEKEQWEEFYDLAVAEDCFGDLDMPEEVPQAVKQAIGKAFEKGWEACYDFYTQVD